MKTTRLYSLIEHGFEIHHRLLTPEQIQTLLTTLTQHPLKPLRGGIRRIDQHIPLIATLANSTLLMQTVARHLPNTPQLIRTLYFEKTPHNNWYVTWHQDKTVSISKRFTAPNWGPWSLKSGVWHVQPPLQVLQNMLTVRIHLDPATIANGCLKVIPGSHTAGLLNTQDIHKQTGNQGITYCEVAAGDAILMRPHILHASEKSTQPQPRRILHFEYSNYKLPENITWHP